MVFRARLATSDVRALLKLVHRLHSAPDPLTRKRQMIEGLCQLTSAHCGLVAVTSSEEGLPQARLVSLVEFRCDGVGSECLPQNVVPLNAAARAPGDDLARATAESRRIGPEPLSLQWPSSRLPDDRYKTLISSCPLINVQISATICLFRAPGRIHPFTRRHRLLVDLFHQEVFWIYQPDLLLLSASARALSPRERQTLELLLAGMSEKQIAAKLKLSTNTIHHYVKSLHRHFDVSTRSELLARWVGK